jgi:hypothetical protein
MQKWCTMETNWFFFFFYVKQEVLHLSIVTITIKLNSLKKNIYTFTLSAIGEVFRTVL